MKPFFLLLLSLLLAPVSAQNFNSTVLDDYIKEALDHNLALKQKQFSYQKSVQALKEARGMFMPVLSIEARYSRAGGGRQFDIPIGDLMNPVYSSLNQIFTALSIPTQDFPTLQNEHIPFLREHEQETKLRLVQPIFQYGLYGNYSVKKHLLLSDSAAVAAYKNLLKADVKTAYYRYLQESQLVDLYNNTLDILLENVRVSISLFQNNVATKDVVYRAQTEKLKIDQEITKAEEQVSLAKSYFNFLLNRPLDNEIVTIDLISLPQSHPYTLEEAEELALKNRYELKQLGQAAQANQSAVGIANASFMPGINLVVDYGFQGEKYRFTKDDDYWMASAVLSWNLFNGFSDKARHEQKIIDTKNTQAALKQLKTQIRLQVQDAFYALQVSQKSLLIASEQEKSATETFKIISKKYEQGMASQVEFVDARVNMTNASTNNIITRFDYLIHQVDLNKTLNVWN